MNRRHQVEQKVEAEAEVEGEVKVKVGWYCGCFIGPMEWQWQGDWEYEPDTCDTEFETEEFLRDWKEGCCTAICPNCGAVLYQSEDFPLMKE
jgi:hypothetical protein